MPWSGCSALHGVNLNLKKCAVLSVKLIIKYSKICFFFTYADQMNIQQRFNVLLQLQFYNILTNVLPITFKSFQKHFRYLRAA